MTPKEAIIRTLTLLSTVGLGFEFGPQGEIIDGPKSWRVVVTNTEEITKQDPRPDGWPVYGLTQFEKRRIMLSEEVLDSNPAFLITHECAHALSGSPQCNESTGADSPEFLAALETTKKYYTLLFPEGEPSCQTQT